MKDLTHYFTSPKKQLPETEVLNSSLEFESANKPVKKKSTDLEKENEKKQRKKKVKKRKEKRSDPVVNNITHLLSDGLSIISPNTSKTNISVIANDENTDIMQSNVLENDSSTAILNEIPSISSNEGTEVTSVEIKDANPLKQAKQNVFQFMMQNRNSSIGQNSSGIEPDPQNETETQLNKEKLSMRKSILQNWAEIKGASKRKREEDEKEATIDYKLKKRARRLKKMIENMNSDDSSDSIIQAKPRKKISKILSDNETSNDSILSGKSNKELLSFSGIIEAFKGSRRSDSPNIKENGSVSIPKANKEESKTAEKRKRGRPRKIKEVSEPKPSEETLTPRTRKKWQMKIKLEEETEEIFNKNDEGPISSLRKSSRTKKPKNDLTEILLSSDDESPKSQKSTPRKSLKVAPVFLKSVPKPKEAPEVIEARKQFLLSGIPSSLKKIIEKQKSLEEKEFDVFPKIQHVQQKTDHSFWNLSNVELNFKPSHELIFNYNESISDLVTIEKEQTRIKIQNEPINCKKLIEQIKNEHQNYPVYKSYRQILEKSGKKMIKKTPEKKKKGRPKKNSLTKPPPEESTTNYELWTEKYKARSSEDIIGNNSSIVKLKQWLMGWLNIEDRLKRKRKNSESDFDIDSDSRDSSRSSRLPDTMIVLIGPCGSGKSSSVYAICNELGFNVLELNASSKRTGKRLLQEFQEATQSHQVQNKDSLSNYLTSKQTETKSTNNTSKMCVVLIEDVDLVFDQDDGFIVALSQLAQISKRPIILTSTDRTSVHVQKFSNQYQVLNYIPISSTLLAVWLQILCLIEGVYVNLNDVANLLDFNRGDVRKTLLELQFWVLTGGQLFQTNCKIDSDRRLSFDPNWKDEDCIVDFNQSDCKIENFTVNHSIMNSFQWFEKVNRIVLPNLNNLGLLWWNAPNLLLKPNENEAKISKRERRLKLFNYYNYCDVVSLSDVNLRKSKQFKKLDEEPCLKNNWFELRDSLEVKERYEEYCGEFSEDWNQYMLGSTLEKCTETSEGVEFNFALPSSKQKKDRTKLHAVEDVLVEAVNGQMQLHRAAKSLDYFSALREISRIEEKRSNENTKRGNRFRHYFKGLGIRCGDSTLKSVSEIMNFKTD